LPSHIAVYDINGPLFFGAAEKAIATLSRVNTQVSGVILDMSDVPIMDMTGIVALESLIRTLRQRKVAVVISNLHLHLQQKLIKAGMAPLDGELAFCRSLDEARDVVLEMRPS
jgi:SulP family sulfate permease